MIFFLIQIAQYVNNRAYEVAVNKKGGSCRSDWHAWENQAACGFAYRPDGKIFDSQVGRANLRSQFETFCSSNCFCLIGFLLQL